MKSHRSTSILNKLNNNLITSISCYISHRRILNIVRYSKEFQSAMSISLYYYQKYFVLNHFQLNFTTVSSKEILYLLNTEFKNFDKVGDNEILEKIIEEIKDSERIIEVNKNEKEIIGNGKYPYITGHLQNIEMKGKIDNSEEKKMISLYLNSNSREYNNYKKYEKIGPEFELLKMSSDSCNKLKILRTDSNFIIPVSILKNLESLQIYISPKNNLNFMNDVNKDSISLKKLRFLNIHRLKRDYPSEVNKIFINHNNKIRFRLPNIEEILIFLDLNRDLYILKEYFKLYLIDDTFNDVLKNKDVNSVYNYFKEKILHYKFKMVTVHFLLELSYLKNNKKIIMDLEMNKSKNGLKYYYFRKNVLKNGEKQYSIFEGFREDYSNKIIQIYYCNKNGPLEIIDKPSLMKSINGFTLVGEENSHIENKEFKKIFDIEENNYSLQNIIISIKKKQKVFQNLIKNINKFKVLKNLIITDYIDDNDIFYELVNKISAMKLLKTVKISFKGNCDKKTVDLMKKSFLIFSCSKIVYSEVTEYYLSRISNE